MEPKGKATTNGVEETNNYRVVLGEEQEKALSGDFFAWFACQESEVSFFISVEFRWEEAPKPDVTRQAGNKPKL